MIGIVELEGMEFYAYHGCYKEEQVVGNKFIVDLSMKAECGKASVTDNVEDAANYQIAYQVVKEQMSVKSHLLENVAGRILEALGERINGIVSAKVKISKLNPPLGGKVCASSVTIEKLFD